MGPGTGGSKDTPGGFWVMGRGCRDEISFITRFALPDLTREKRVVVDGGEEPRPSHYKDS